MLLVERRAASFLIRSSVRFWSRRSYSQSTHRRLVDVLKNTNNGDTVTVHGFVQSLRKQKKVAFVALTDGSSIEPLQVVLSPDQAEGLSTGAGVQISGQWAATPAGKKQANELRADDVTILAGNDAASYPVQKKYHTPEFLRTVPHLRPRIPHNALLLRLRSQVISSLTKFFEEKDFVQCHTPIITSSDCEGAGEVFSVEAPKLKESPGQTTGAIRPQLEEPFFRTQKYLTVSSQLHLEALALAVRNVWTLSPTFRAEKSDTARHLSEFYMLEAEMAFVANASQVMDVIEEMIKFVTHNITVSRLGQELLHSRKSKTLKDSNEETEADHLDGEALSARWKGLLGTAWPRITYYEACKQIQRAAADGGITFEALPDAESGLDTEHERYLAATYNGPIFVTDYPKVIKPFYMAPSQQIEGQELGSVPTVACWDLLMPDVCEVVGGSMREHRLDELQRMMKEKGMAMNPQLLSEEDGKGENNDKEAAEGSGLEWYVDLRRYGSVPHGGFGLGFDRLLGYLAGVGFGMGNSANVTGNVKVFSGASGEIDKV